MNQININGYTRITRPAARKRHLSGLSVYALPVNVSPASKWIQPAAVPVYEPQGPTFDEWCNAFDYYNCNAECGRYAAFYVEEGETA